MQKPEIEDTDRFSCLRRIAFSLAPPSAILRRSLAAIHRCATYVLVLSGSSQEHCRVSHHVSYASGWCARSREAVPQLFFLRRLGLPEPNIQSALLQMPGVGRARTS